jgi:hypothetical protein
MLEEGDRWVYEPVMNRLETAIATANTALNTVQTTIQAQYAASSLQTEANRFSSNVVVHRNSIPDVAPDTAALALAIARAKAVCIVETDADLYLTWGLVLRGVIDRAKMILDSPTATQGDIDAMAAELSAATGNIENAIIALFGVNALKAAVTYAHAVRFELFGFIGSEGRFDLVPIYTDLDSAIEAAELALAASITHDEIDRITTGLFAAIAAARVALPPPDATGLKAVITEAKAVSDEMHNIMASEGRMELAFIWWDLLDAIKKAEIAFAEQKTQSEIDAAAAGLRAAIAAAEHAISLPPVFNTAYLQKLVADAKTTVSEIESIALGGQAYLFEHILTDLQAVLYKAEAVLAAPITQLQITTTWHELNNALIEAKGALKASQPGLLPVSAIDIQSEEKPGASPEDEEPDVVCGEETFGTLISEDWGYRDDAEGQEMDG